MRESYSGLITSLTPKQKRIFAHNLAILFSSSGYLSKPSIEQLNSLWPSRPAIKHERGIIFLSDKGIEALHRLVRIVCSVSSAMAHLAKGDVNTTIIKEIENWLIKGIEPEVVEFLASLEQRLFGLIHKFTYLVKLEGLELNGIERLELGHLLILKNDPAILAEVQFGKNLDKATVLKLLSNCTWLMATEEGSERISRQRFEYRANLVIGTLGIFGAILYKESIWRSRVRAITSANEVRDPALRLHWMDRGEGLTLTKDWGAQQDLLLDAEKVTYLTENCFLKELCAIISSNERTEVEETIARAVYWFAEAYKDQTHVMRFVKLWSCAECFFSIETDKVTELNARGITTVLTYAGFKIFEVRNYNKVKRRVRQLYDLRSRALHKGEHAHIDETDLNELSHWAAWLIISMTALTKRGYKKLQQIYQQAERIDEQATRREK